MLRAYRFFVLAILTVNFSTVRAVELDCGREPTGDLDPAAVWIKWCDSFGPCSMVASIARTCGDVKRIFDKLQAPSAPNRQAGRDSESQEEAFNLAVSQRAGCRWPFEWRRCSSSLELSVDEGGATNESEGVTSTSLLEPSPQFSRKIALYQEDAALMREFDAKCSGGRQFKACITALENIEKFKKKVDLYNLDSALLGKWGPYSVASTKMFGLYGWKKVAGLWQNDKFLAATTSCVTGFDQFDLALNSRDSRKAAASFSRIGENCSELSEWIDAGLISRRDKYLQLLASNPGDPSDLSSLVSARQAQIAQGVGAEVDLAALRTSPVTQSGAERERDRARLRELQAAADMESQRINERRAQEERQLNALDSLGQALIAGAEQRSALRPSGGSQGGGGVAIAARSEPKLATSPAISVNAKPTAETTQPREKRMSSPASGCVKIETVSPFQGWDKEATNTCSYSITISWCTIDVDCTNGQWGYTNTWELGPGKRYTLTASGPNIGKTVVWGACRGYGTSVIAKNPREFSCGELFKE